VAGIKILDLIADGVTDAQTLASSVTTKIKRKEDAKKALTNCLTTEHIFVIKQLMNQYRDIANRILDVDNELAEKMRPFAHLIEELKKIPGIDRVLVMGILAEATADMKSFADERKFAAWAGVASGNNLMVRTGRKIAKKMSTKCRLAPFPSSQTVTNTGILKRFWWPLRDLNSDVLADTGF
jgi:transposase